MLVVENPAALAGFVSKRIGISAWRLIDQKTIALFAAATGDHQWIHTDVERVRREAPGGRTIAHGFLLVSLIPSMTAEILRIETCSRSINYGLNRVRFTAPMPSGARICLILTLVKAEPVTGGFRFVWDNVLALENSDRPAMVAETITVLYP